MSAKTKIVVLHMKELIYTGIFVALGILFIILLVIMFLPHNKDNQTGNTSTEEQTEENSAVASDSVYIPGIYTTELILGGQTIDVEVIVEEDSITSVRMINLSEAVTTMYPLLQPTFDSICEQIYETQSLEEISYTSDSKYTSLVLLEAIQTSLDKARPNE
ncbi:MAG: hypothetical protein E7291_06515 [Lachnospiraceae bacterium]|nr:hypothetical protein [Lachnospiraceae bacterium]